MEMLCFHIVDVIVERKAMLYPLLVSVDCDFLKCYERLRVLERQRSTIIPLPACLTVVLYIYETLRYYQEQEVMIRVNFRNCEFSLPSVFYFCLPFSFPQPIFKSKF